MIAVKSSFLVFSAALLLGTSAPTLIPIAFAATDSTTNDQSASDAQDENDKTNNSSSATTTESTVANAKKKGETQWSDIEYLKDANNVTMVDYKNLFLWHGDRQSVQS